MSAGYRKGTLVWNEFHLGIVAKKKQPSKGVLKKRCSENMQQVCMTTPMPKCDFNDEIKLHNNEINLRYGCSPVNLLYIFRAPILKSTSGGLPLKKSLILKFIRNYQKLFIRRKPKRFFIFLIFSFDRKKIKW